MGKKYLETRTGSLEQSILGLWEKAAENQEDTVDPSRKRELKKSYQDKQGGREHGGSPGAKRALGYGSTDHQGRGLKKGHTSGDKGNYGTAQAKKNDAKTGSVSGMAYDKKTGSKNAKLADLRRKRDALKKEREKLAASFDAQILELDNLLESLINEHKGDKPHKHPHEEKELDDVNPKANKKKFKDRKDKDIDNDGDVDSSDKFLHKRRKAIAKNTREAWEEAYRLVQEKDTLGGDTTPDEDDGDDVPAKKKSKTDTGKKPDEIKMNPDMDEYYKAMKKKK